MNIETNVLDIEFLLASIPIFPLITFLFWSHPMDSAETKRVSYRKFYLMSQTKLQKLFKSYFEIAAFSMGLLLLALMNPGTPNGPSLCVLDQIGISFCPGDGLGHSIAYSFRGDIGNAMESHILGPATIIIIAGRIGYLVRQRIKFSKK